jgi:hypothetical protein
VTIYEWQNDRTPPSAFIAVEVSFVNKWKPLFFDGVNTIFIYFWGLSGLSVSQLWFSGPALWAMASQASESQRWSCGTLQDGFDVMDLAIQEQKILREIQAIINLSHLTMFKSKCMVPYILNYLPLLHPDRTWMMNLSWRAVLKVRKVRIWGFQRTIKRI